MSDSVMRLQSELAEMEERAEKAEAELQRITTCPSCRTTHYACECGIKARFDLEAENKRLLVELGQATLIERETHDELVSERHVRAAVGAENKRLREALEFYADENNWVPNTRNAYKDNPKHTFGFKIERYIPVREDFGSIARQALAEKEEPCG